jgi:GntR family transcriptional repressor for pyruvate dehydrogenase complex
MVSGTFARGDGRETVAADLQPLAATRRADGVFEQLRSRILSGAFPAGERLPNERDLAAALEVNRASVREAVKRLEFLELVEVRHGQGTFVRELGESSALQLVEALLRDPRTVTRELLAQLLEFRRQVTLQVVDLAVRRRSEEHLERAQELIRAEESRGAEPQTALALDIAMNGLLGEATGNLMYQIVTNLFTRLVRRLGPLYYNEGRDHRRSLATHRQLLEAIAVRDVGAAHRLVSRMLDYSEERILDEAGRLEALGLLGPVREGA